MSLPDAAADRALGEGLAALGLSLGDEARGRLERFIQEIELWNPRLKLVAAAGRELVVKHILDSLAPHAVLAAVLGECSRGEIADLGSGAGLPGIPLAIALPHAHVSLIERSGRRVGFLRNCVAVLKLSNVTVVERDAFLVAQEERRQLVVMRAFLPLSDALLDAVAGMLVPGGTALLYKGRLSVAQADQELASEHPAFAEARLEPVSVPFLTDERHLLVLRSA
mgnify:FL=1